ncbi:hypothetical protein AB6A40_007144 [Gnathostoma spinigerum]|uniref:lysoplasmalogenase n=1 Tax=Gnathostoma spinigerum TaxID=75299 RepID=A0ABD6EKD0_9BILA
MNGPAQMMAVYTGITGLVYIETDGFRRAAFPLLKAMPSIALALMTLSLSMRARTKYLTAASFIVMGAGIYKFNFNHGYLQWSCILISIARILYLLSFAEYIRRLWNPLSFLTTVYFFGLLYHCFSDLYSSIPSLFITMCLYLATVCISVIAAGSLWKYGSKRSYGGQADFLRFLGLLLGLINVSVLMLNLFSTRFSITTFAFSSLFYLSQGLQFLANERAF